MGIIFSECPDIIIFKEIFPEVNPPTIAAEVPEVGRKDINKVKQFDMF